MNTRSFAFAVLLLLSAAAAGAQGLTREEALAAVYPGATFEAERVFLTNAQVDAAAALGREDVPSALVARYVARRNGQVVGRAYVDTHVVRTKRESLLIALDADGALQRIEVTAFLEPPEFQAPAAWLGQFNGHVLGDDLAVNRAIRPMAGATLTARATTEAVRRVMAIDAVVEGRTR
jgi:electron transport complex protein RnfG